MLFGDSSDFRNIVPCFSSSARKADQALIHLLGDIAAARKVTPAQIARVSRQHVLGMSGERLLTGHARLCVLI